MNKFDERKKAFEDKFMHDAELEFKVNAKANKMIGMWAAAKIGLNEKSSKQYAIDLVKSDIEKHNQQNIIDKIYNDLQKANINIEKLEIENQMLECKKQSYQYFMEEE